jgi:hypothetical protein
VPILLKKSATSSERAIFESKRISSLIDIAGHASFLNHYCSADLSKSFFNIICHKQTSRRNKPAMIDFGGSILNAHSVGDAAFNASVTVMQGVTYYPSMVLAAVTLMPMALGPASRCRNG